MKTTYRIFLSLFVISVLFVSCKKETPNQIIIAKPSVDKPRQTQRIGDYEQTMDMQWGGAAYTVLVSRVADESLPLADDGLGNKFFDNKIHVKIVRSDGSVFFERTFLKSDFAQYIDERSRRNDAILGVVFDKAEGDYAYFAASIGSPDIVGSDEYTPFIVKISRGGNMTITKDMSRDTNGDNSSSSIDIEEEEGV